MIGLITDNDETAYREEVSTLTKWCQENHLSLNIDKDQGAGGGLQETEQRTHTHHHRQDTLWSGWPALSSSAFTSPRISHGLLTQMQCCKKAHQRLFFLRRLRKFGTSPRILRSFYTCTVGEHPDRLYHRLVWKQHRWQPQGSAKGRANCPPHCWRWASLPPGYLHQAVVQGKARRIIKRLQPPVPQTALSAALRATFPQHPIPALADWGTAFFPQAIRLMNSHK